MLHKVKPTSKLSVTQIFLPYLNICWKMLMNKKIPSKKWFVWKHNNFYRSAPPDLKWTNVNTSNKHE